MCGAYPPSRDRFTYTQVFDITAFWTKPRPTLSVTLSCVTTCSKENPPKLTIVLPNRYHYASHSSHMNSLKSPLVASSMSACSSRLYLSAYARLTRIKCILSQCKRTRREINNSYRNSSFLFFSAMSWIACWRSMASRVGLLITPFKIWATTSPYNDAEIRFSTFNLRFW